MEEAKTRLQHFEEPTKVDNLSLKGIFAIIWVECGLGWCCCNGSICAGSPGGSWSNFAVDTSSLQSPTTRGSVTTSWFIRDPAARLLPLQKIGRQR